MKIIAKTSTYSNSSTIIFLSCVKRTFTLTDDKGNGKPVSSTKSFGRYRKYLPSFLLKNLPKLSLTNSTPLIFFKIFILYISILVITFNYH